MQRAANSHYEPTDEDAAMSDAIPKPTSVSQAEFLGAALRYCAVADWFEAHPCPWSRTMSPDQAMALFNQVE